MLIEIGKTYSVYCKSKYTISEIEVYEKDKDQRCTLETVWKNGSFEVTIENEDEKAELEACMNDDATFFSFEFSNHELSATFDGEGPTCKSSGDGWKNLDEANAFDESFEEAREDDPDDDFEPAEWLSEQGFKDIDFFYTIEDGVFIELLEDEKNAPPGNQ